MINEFPSENYPKVLIICCTSDILFEISNPYFVWILMIAKEEFKMAWRLIASSVKKVVKVCVGGMALKQTKWTYTRRPKKRYHENL